MVDKQSMWTVQHLLGTGSLMEFSSSSLPGRAGAPEETWHGPQYQNQHLKCAYTWSVHVLCFGAPSVFSWNSGLSWWNLNIYLLIFHSHHISPLPGSMLWLWPALCSVLL